MCFILALAAAVLSSLYLVVVLVVVVAVSGRFRYQLPDGASVSPESQSGVTVPSRQSNVQT